MRFDSLLSDLRYAFRTLRRDAPFAGFGVLKCGDRTSFDLVVRSALPAGAARGGRP